MISVTLACGLDRCLSGVLKCSSVVGFLEYLIIYHDRCQYPLTIRARAVSLAGTYCEGSDSLGLLTTVSARSRPARISGRRQFLVVKTAPFTVNFCNLCAKD